MSRKGKIDPAEKVKLVEQVLADEISTAEAARLTGVDRTSTLTRDTGGSVMNLTENMI